MTKNLQLTQNETFFTPAQLAKEQVQHGESARGRLVIASCRSGAYLAQEVVDRYQELLATANAQAEIPHLDSIDYRFPTPKAASGWSVT